MTKILLAACAALALSGCVTAEEMAAQVAAKDDNECHSYGAPTGTDAYFQCRMVKSQQRVQFNTAATAAANAQFQHGLDMMAAAAAPPPMQTIVVAPTY
jgi:hypothetical protein